RAVEGELHEPVLAAAQGVFVRRVRVFRLRPAPEGRAGAQQQGRADRVLRPAAHPQLAALPGGAALRVLRLLAGKEHEQALLRRIAAVVAGKIQSHTMVMSSSPAFTLRPGSMKISPTRPSV